MDQGLPVAPLMPEEFEDDDGLFSINLDVTEGDEVSEEPLSWDDDEPNLVPIFAGNAKGKRFLKKFSTDALGEFDTAHDSSAEYRERRTDDWSIFAGELPEKPYPWENCANPHVPIMMKTIGRIQSRMSMEIFGDWGRVFNVNAVGPSENEAAVARVLTKHGNWQFRSQIYDFKRQMHRAILNFLVSGDVTCHSFYDPITEKNRHEILTCDEFVIPYVLTTTMPDYSDVPFTCKIVNKYRHEVQKMRDIWYDIDRVLDREPPSWEDEPEAELARATAEVNGIEVPDESSYTPYKFIEWQGYVELPKNHNVDADSRGDDRYVKAVIDTTTKAVVSLMIMEEPDWQDQERYRLQLRERDQYFMAKQVWEEQIQPAMEQDAAFDEQVDSGLIMPSEAMRIYEARLANPMPGQAPQPPQWMIDPEDPEEEPPPVKMRPVNGFSHGVCQENLAGSLGLGTGRIEADFNRNANTALSQFSDAAHLANNWSLIVTDELGFEQQFELSPGKINKATGVTGMDLKNGIMELKPDPANGQLVEIVNMMNGYGEEAIPAPDVLSGNPGKSGETYRGISTRVEQATKQLSWYSSKFVEFFEWICKNNAALNFQYLPDHEIVMVNDHELQIPEPITISNELYARNYDVEIRSDLQFSTKAQKIAEADELVQMPQAIPALQTNLLFQYKAAVKALRARGEYEMVEALGKPPPDPGTFGQAMMGPPGPPGPGEEVPPSVPEGGPVNQ